MPSPSNSTVLLRIRPSLPDPDEVSASRGPLMMESVLSTLHSLRGKNGELSLEIGNADGKIGLFARSTPKAAPLLESQFYSQYPDCEIEKSKHELFEVQPGEKVFSTDLVLSDPEVFPIKRHPQFMDLVSRQSIDPIAGMTSALVR